MRTNKSLARRGFVIHVFNASELQLFLHFLKRSVEINGKMDQLICLIFVEIILDLKKISCSEAEVYEYRMTLVQSYGFNNYCINIESLCDNFEKHIVNSVVKRNKQYLCQLGTFL